MLGLGVLKNDSDLVFVILRTSLCLTARQYGEVVLPEYSNAGVPDTHRVDPCTLARKLSRNKEGMALVFAIRVQILLSITRVAVQIYGAGNYLGTKFVRGTGAVSRYKLSRSQKSVTVQDFNCGQMRVSGCNNHYKFVLGAGAKAKSVTNNLPILSVLAFRYLFLLDLIHVLLLE